jgi:hypothetical protein
VGAIISIDRLLYELTVFFNRLIAFLFPARQLYIDRCINRITLLYVWLYISEK